jgi:hypothetical protein
VYEINGLGGKAQLLTSVNYHSRFDPYERRGVQAGMSR